MHFEDKDKGGSPTLHVRSDPLPSTLDMTLPEFSRFTKLSTAPLFTPFSLKKITLPNRILMAPMTRNFSHGGVPGPNVAAYYQRRAENAVGLIVTEGTAINHPASADSTRVPHFYGEDALAGWAKVVAEVHAAGGLIMPQLWHVGMSRDPKNSPYPEVPSVGPSGLVTPGSRVGEPLSEIEIEGIVCAYAQAAADAKRLGFDGLELHGAHGYLIDQFFWAGTNQRTDRYGGDIAARTQFAADIIKACRARVGNEFPIALRFSQWKIKDYEARLVTSPGELEQFLTPLIEAGVDLFHCSTRRFWEPEFEGSSLNLAGWTRKLSGKPTVTVGSVGLDEEFMSSLRQGKEAHPTGLDRIIGMIDKQEVDLVAIGRALLVDPQWAQKIRYGRFQELVPYTPQARETLW